MKRGTPSHPKTYALAEALGIKRRDAVGLLEMLFHFTAEYAPAGDIGKYPNRRIAAALDWPLGSADRLIEGLTTSGWVEKNSVHFLVVHDWEDHMTRQTRRTLSDSGRSAIVNDQSTSQQNLGLSGNSVHHADPESSPRLALPYQAKPSQAAAKPVNAPPPTNGDFQSLIKTAAAAKSFPPVHRRSAELPLDLKTWELVRELLTEFPGVAQLPGKPDDDIIRQCIDLGHSDTELLLAAFRKMAKRKKGPSLSWGWFPTVLRQYVG